MSEQKYFPAKYSTAQFHCPHCGVYAEQKWAYVIAQGSVGNHYGLSEVRFFNEVLSSKFVLAKCQHCDEISIWVNKKMIYPRITSVAEPNDDLSDDIKRDYIEAATILNESPRASAALLRLALQKLCKELGEKGEDINEDIGSLVKKGLNSQVQKSLDSLRITGNNAVHPGEINLKEEPERVEKLFQLINFVADKMLTEPKEVESFYGNLPENSKKQIEERDKLKKGKL